MIFEHTKLAGAVLISPELIEDERGFFARTFCQNEFKAQNLVFNFVQSSMSVSPKRHTLRGLHFQHSPHEETKLIRCTRGAIYDVIVDLRPGSPTSRQWLAVELNASNKQSLYVPRGFAHGFMTLTDDCEVTYMIDQAYVAESSAGLKYNDPELAINWPFKPSVISDRDNNFPSIT